MLVVGDELYRLIEKTNLAPISSYDETCIKLSINKTIVRFHPLSEGDCIIYGNSLSDDMISYETIEDNVLFLKPKESLLASSVEEINIPLGYMGFLQTKGSLARLMVSIHFSDGQIDPGFSGHITFEIFNASNNNIGIPIYAPIGNLYIIKTIGIVEPYNGKYSGSILPTIQK